MRAPTGPDGLAYLAELATQDPEYESASAVYDTVQSVCAGLKRMRLRRGFGQGELGRILGVSQGRMSQIESGLVDHAPSLDMMARYAAACGEKLEIGFSGDTKSRHADPLPCVAGDMPLLTFAMDQQTGLVSVDRFGTISIPDAVAAAMRNHPADIEIVGSSMFRARGNAAYDMATAMVGGLCQKGDMSG